MTIIKKFRLDESDLAKTIYKDCPHKTTKTGLVLSEEIRQELQIFLKQFLCHSGELEEGLFFRIDAFIGDGKLHIIEVNVELQDGWGVALNLVRASGNCLSLNGEVMPKTFIDYGNGYKSEFELACTELGLLGVEAVVETKPYYLRGTSIQPPKHELDSKMYLARFSEKWDGEDIIIPRMYNFETTPWESLPEDVFFKFCLKYGPGALRARYSVIERSKAGKAKFVRQCYNDGSLVAQERVSPFTLKNGSVTQAVIMCSGSQPVTGYLQVSPPGTAIINDKTAKAGPLLFA